jgi:hypothetical protein
MNYLLLIYGNETAMLNAPKEASSQMHAAYMPLASNPIRWCAASCKPSCRESSHIVARRWP